jgi:hypothetical protein
MRRAIGYLALGLATLIAPAAGASGAPQPATGFAWSETSGWVDFAPDGGGVIVHDEYLSGFAWSGNLGWIKLGSDGGGPYANTSATDWGVNRPADGALTGYAWSETSGWIRFDPRFSPVTVAPDTGIFDGYAWSERVGWIHIRNADPAYGPTIQVSPAEIPALGGSGLAVLALGLATLGVSRLKKTS